MQDFITFKSISYDTITLSPVLSRYSVFNDDCRLINSNPVTLRTEKEIVKWLFAREYFVQMLLESSGQKMRIMEVPLLETPRAEFRSSPQKDGDFDVIYRGYGKSDDITCIEFKRIKFDQISDYDDPKINGLSNLDKLISQGNIARGSGFHNTFIAVVGLINTSRLQRPNSFTKFDPPTEYKMIYDLHNIGRLDPAVGILLIEIEQAIGLDYNRAGQIRIAELRRSTEQTQSRRVTEDFRRLMFKRNYNT